MDVDSEIIDTGDSKRMNDSRILLAARRAKAAPNCSNEKSDSGRYQQETNGPQTSTRKHSLRQLRSSKASKPGTLRRKKANRYQSKLPKNFKLPSTLDNLRQEKLQNEVQALNFAAGDESSFRPYLSSSDRGDIRNGFVLAERYHILSRSERASLRQLIFHVDFSLDELQFLCEIVQRFSEGNISLNNDVRNQIISLMGGRENMIPRVLSTVQQVVNLPGQEVGRILLRKRSTEGIKAFLGDAVAGKIADAPQLVRVESSALQNKTSAQPPISSLLRQREINGMQPVRARRGQQSFKVEVASYLEDTLSPKSEWTDCCGDISTLSWSGEGTFVCGATAHSDYHNMQYNKPGNLAVGSCSLDTLRAVADHRIIRPLIDSSDNTENALEAMRQTQDPWLYTSVVSSSYCDINEFTFTASFDHTVKVWHVAKDGSSIDLRGSWLHDGTVNFVVTSTYHERVATASDVSSNAIRVYDFDENDINRTPHDTYCGEKALEQAQELRRRDNWAYFPATIQWGKAPGVADFLLVGYSPRSMTGHDMDIPEEKRNTGELCLWDVTTGNRIIVSSPRTQNVFEVMWHPTQPLFVAATSPCGNFERETRTQIRLFVQNESGTFQHIKALDCPAFDVNELTIMSVSFFTSILN